MVSAYEEELESDVFGCCGEGAGVVEVPGIIGSWHANITKTILRLSRYFRFDFNLIYSFLCFLKVNQSEKQISKFSLEPRTKLKYFCISA